jgi:uncharacterized protein YutE (UPF0331/DUF86 family)
LEVILEKIENLRRCLVRIEEKVSISESVFLEGLDFQDVTVLNLERAVQICVDVGAHLLAQKGIFAPSTMSQVFDRLQELQIIGPDLTANLKKAVGFRNLAVHEYSELDYSLVYAIATDHLNDFKEFARNILNSLNHLGND